MSSGHGAWESRIEIGRQSGLGTAPTNWHVLPIDSADSLTFGPQMADRKPVYGGRTRPETSYRKDHELPAGGLGDWAVLMDESSHGFLRVLDMFYQHSAVVTSGTTAPADWTFQPLGTFTASTSLHTYGIQKAVGDGGTRDERYLDCIGDTLSWKHSTGNPLMLTLGMRSLSGTNLTISATGSTLLGVPLATPEIVERLTINGTSFAVYPSSSGCNESNNLVDSTGAGAAQRQRHVIGGHSGDISMTLPRNSVLAAVQNAYNNNYTGTFLMTLRPSTGTYSYGGGTLSASYTAYIRFDRPDAPAGGDGELTWELTGQIVGAPVWTLQSIVGSIT